MEFETEIIMPVKSNETKKPISVYVKKDSTGKVIDLDSDLFITDFSGWEKIDEGFGDKYAHAKSLYRFDGFENYASSNEDDIEEESIVNVENDLNQNNKVNTNLCNDTDVILQ